MLRFKKKASVALIILIAIFVLNTCASLETVFREPLVSFDSAKLTAVTMHGADLLCKIKIDNPNKIDIPFPAIDWELFLNSNEFVKGTILNNSSLKARGSTLVDVPLSLDYLEVFNLVKSLIGTKEAEYKVALAAKFNLPVFGERIWNFEHDGILPVLQAPKVSRPSLKIDKLDFTKAELLFSMDVENPNIFEIPMPKMDYDYKVNNNSFIRSSVQTGSALAAGAVTPVMVRLAVNYQDLFQSFHSLSSLNEVSSLLSMRSDFGIPALPEAPALMEQAISLPLLKVPNLSFGGIRLKNMSLTNIEFELNWEVENNNNFAMNVKDLIFNFAVNNSTWASGRIPDYPQIAANRKTSIPLTFSLNSLSMIRDITSIVTQGGNINYSCAGNLNLGSALPGLSDFNTPFNYAGTSRLSR